MISVQTPTDLGGLGGSALFISTEGEYPSSRLDQMVASLKEHSEEELAKLNQAASTHADHEIDVRADGDASLKRQKLEWILSHDFNTHVYFAKASTLDSLERLVLYQVESEIDKMDRCANLSSGRRGGLRGQGRGVGLPNANSGVNGLLPVRLIVIDSIGAVARDANETVSGKSGEDGGGGEKAGDIPSQSNTSENRGSLGRGYIERAEVINRICLRLHKIATERSAVVVVANQVGAAFLSDKLLRPRPYELSQSGEGSHNMMNVDISSLQHLLAVPPGTSRTGEVASVPPHVYPYMLPARDDARGSGGEVKRVKPILGTMWAAYLNCRIGLSRRDTRRKAGMNETNGEGSELLRGREGRIPGDRGMTCDAVLVGKRRRDEIDQGEMKVRLGSEESKDGRKGIEGGRAEMKRKRVRQDLDGGMDTNDENPRVRADGEEEVEGVEEEGMDVVLETMGELDVFGINDDDDAGDDDDMPIDPDSEEQGMDRRRDPKQSLVPILDILAGSQSSVQSSNDVYGRTREQSEQGERRRGRTDRSWLKQPRMGSRPSHDNVDNYNSSDDEGSRGVNPWLQSSQLITLSQQQSLGSNSTHPIAASPLTTTGTNNVTSDAPYSRSVSHHPHNTSPPASAFSSSSKPGARVYTDAVDRRAYIVFSPHLPPRCVQFTITQAGVIGLT